MQYIYGKNSVETYIMYMPTAVKEVYLVEGQDEQKLKQMMQHIRDEKISYQFINKKEVKKYIDDRAVHQGIIAKVAPFQYQNLDVVLQQTKQQDKIPFFILLDKVQDPRNLGAILRTADCAGGVDGVIITKHESADITASAIKTSTGAAMNIPIIQVTNAKNALQTLKKHGIWIACLDMEGAVDYRVQAYDLPLCVVLGGEDAGIRPIIKKESDFNVYIPMHSKTVNSLNISVAASLLLYEVMYSRQK